MSLESGYTATITIDRPAGEPDISITCETCTGGNLSTADSNKHRNPVTRKETARGGLRTRDDVTLTTEGDAAVLALRTAIDDSVGRDRATAVKQMVGPRGEAIGAPQSWSGILDAANWPDYDLDSGDTGMVEFVISTDE